MKRNSTSSWMRKYQFDTAQTTTTTQRKTTTALRKRATRRYTVTAQEKYAQTQGTPTRGPLIKANYWYTDKYGNVYAKWNEYDEWERVA